MLDAAAMKQLLAEPARVRNVWAALATPLEQAGDPRGELLRLTAELTHELHLPDRAKVEARLVECVERLTAGESILPSWVNSLGVRMLLVPPGKFLMGSPTDEPDRGEGELQRPVELSQPFLLAAHPVTQHQYAKLIGENPSGFSPQGESPETDTNAFPVESVTWNEACDFCRQLTVREREAGLLPDNWAYVLPTEAQWEYACRAGTTSATPWGDQLSSTQANFVGIRPYNGAAEGPSLQRSCEVGRYAPNAWGFYPGLSAGATLGRVSVESKSSCAGSFKWRQRRLKWSTVCAAVDQPQRVDLGRPGR